MSRPQFTSVDEKLSYLACFMIASPHTAGEVFRECERELSWLTWQWPRWHRPSRLHHRAEWTLSHAHADWVEQGKPEDEPRLTAGLGLQLADDISRGRRSWGMRRMRGGEMAKPHSAGWHEQHLMLECGCTIGPYWMAVDAQGNIRDEEIAINAAREHYHTCDHATIPNRTLRCR